MVDDLAEVIQQARDWDFQRERSQQTEAGWSQMAGCRAELGFRVRGEWATDDVDEWRAEAGTALHAWLTGIRRAAAEAAGRDMAFEQEVSYGGIPGHADEIGYDNGRVTDYKFPAMKSIRYWDDPLVQDEKFVQVQGYAAAVIGTKRWQEAASKAGRKPEDLTVRLLVAPVDGTFADWRMFERPFDRAVADAAVARYEYVQEAVAAGDELPRDKDTWWCSRWCEFFTACRGGEPADAGGDWPEILDAETAAALEQYGEALAQESAAKTVKEQAAPLLRGLRGQARGWRVHMTAGGAGKPVEDMDQIRKDYAASDVDLPMTWKQGSVPSLSVTRVPAEKKTRARAKAADR